MDRVEDPESFLAFVYALIADRDLGYNPIGAMGRAALEVRFGDRVKVSER